MKCLDWFSLGKKDGRSQYECSVSCENYQNGAARSADQRWKVVLEFLNNLWGLGTE